MERPRWKLLRSMAKGDKYSLYKLEVPGTLFCANLFKHPRKGKAGQWIAWHFEIKCGTVTFRHVEISHEQARLHNQDNLGCMKRMVQEEFVSVFDRLGDLVINA